MPMPDAALPAPETVEQAIQWMIRLRFSGERPTDDVTRAFEHWLAQRPEHALAWRRVEGLGEDFDALPRGLARRTLDGAHLRLRRRDGLKCLALLVGAGALGWAGYVHGPLPALMADYRTATGERRRLRLADGSNVQLNTGSALDVDFDGERRVLHLLQGELLAEIRDDSRPLWVRCRDGLLRASSGCFLLRQQDDDTLLAVRRGVVQVFPGGHLDHSATPVGADERLLFDIRGTTRAADDGLDPWSWSDGVLSVRDMRLGDFIATLSRYRTGLLHCSPEVAGLRVSGTYQLKDTDSILRLLAQALPIQVNHRTAWWVTLEART